MFTGLLAVLIVGTLAGSVEADRGDWRYRTPYYPRYSRDYYDGYGGGYGTYWGGGGHFGDARCDGLGGPGGLWGGVGGGGRACPDARPPCRFELACARVSWPPCGTRAGAA